MLETLGKNAKEAEKILMTASTDQKNKALFEIANSLINNAKYIIDENAKDLENAENSGMPPAMVDRLMLNEDRIKKMADGVIDVENLDDPVGRVLSRTTRPNGLEIEKVSTPLGVIAVIFESRPNVTSDAAALCLKSGNTVILRGGKEAINSNTAICDVMRRALSRTDLPEDVIQLVEDTSREGANELMRMNNYVDVLIPRGGAGLIQSVVKNATVPVIETGVGNCHIYVDKDADIDMATSIVYNAKTSRPSVCNAAESLIVHEDIADKALFAIKKELDKKNVRLFGDERAMSIIDGIEEAVEEDWGREYLGYAMSVKIVGSMDEAIEHIYRYGTGHSECIVTDNKETAEEFLDRVDAAAVYVNASTRFTDGGEFGYGAEIGISTQKLHVRGPIGLPELQSFKYKIRGNGQVR